MERLHHRPTPSTTADICPAQRTRWAEIVQWPWHQIGLLLVSDISAIALAWQLAQRFNPLDSPLPPQLVWWTWLGLPSLFWIFIAITLVLFAKAGLYTSTTQWKNYLRTAKLVSGIHLLTLVISYFYDPNLDVPRSLFFTSWFSSATLVVGFRLIATLILRQFEQRQARVPVFIIARAERLAKLANVLKQRSHYKIVGAALSATAHSQTTLQSIINSQAQEVIAESLPNTELASGLFWQLQRSGITLRLLPSSREMLHRRGVPEVFAGLPTLRIATPVVRGFSYCIKRCIDFLGAAVGVIALAPLLIGVAIAIKLTSPGPIFFQQERMGLNRRIFQVWKFRTMIIAPVQTELEAQNQATGVMLQVKVDPRVTKIGHFLRRTNIDELPQLFNVLLGQMSLVGPRPLPLQDIQHFTAWHHIRHQVLPGITGLWQISGRSDSDDFDDVARLDLYYIDNWSLNLDLEILVETVRILLFGRGAC